MKIVFLDFLCAEIKLHSTENFKSGQLIVKTSFVEPDLLLPPKTVSSEYKCLE